MSITDCTALGATPAPPEKLTLDQDASSTTLASWTALKDRIKAHYDVCSSYYLNMWGQHIHHGYWPPALPSNIPKDTAQELLIHLLLQRAGLPIPESSLLLTIPDAPEPTNSLNGRKLKILDVGCGVGGTTRYLARELGAEVLGVTISSEQVKIAYDLSSKEVAAVSGKEVASEEEKGAEGDALGGKTLFIGEKGGSVRFIELDAEKISQAFSPQAGTFDLVWISEALSHLPNKPLFFESASTLLRPASDGPQAGKLVVADWFKAPGLTDEEFEADVKPIEVGMLLPPLGTMDEYCEMAQKAGLQPKGEVLDISKEVAKTWDISLALIQSPSLWAFAFTQGRDFVSFLKAFQAMRRGFANGTFRYGVGVFEKV